MKIATAPTPEKIHLFPSNPPAKVEALSSPHPFLKICLVVPLSAGGGGGGGAHYGPLICSANQWTGFYMIGTSVIKPFKFKMLGQE